MNSFSNKVTPKIFAAHSSRCNALQKVSFNMKYITRWPGSNVRHICPFLKKILDFVYLLQESGVIPRMVKTSSGNIIIKSAQLKC